MSSGTSITIVVPMAGLGSRFAMAGFERPKPFVDVYGRPMIARVLENLAFPNARVVLIGQREHLLRHPDIVSLLEEEYGAEFVPIDGMTDGTAITLMFARHAFSADQPLLVANCDQIIDGGITGMITDCLERRLDGSIMVFEDAERNPKWSFARLGDGGMVAEVREKQPISPWATVGIYLFSRGRDFVEANIDMIIRNDRTNGEFYTCPVYNHLIAAGGRIGVFEIAPAAMHGIGTPEDLAAFLETRPVS